jgi:hypothetical protein
MPHRNPRIARIIDRIRKLAALAEGGGTEAEAEQAMKRVHGLLARHNLRLEDVLETIHRTESKDREHETVEAANNPWERPVWNTTASLYFCEYFFERSFQRAGGGYRAVRVIHNLVGRPHNILVARLMTDYFLKTIRRLARREARCVPKSARNSFAHSFKVACAARLADRIWDRKHQTRMRPTHLDDRDGASFLPALRPLYQVEEEANRELLASLGIRLTHSGRARPRITDVLGEHAGKRAADGIGLDPQLPAGHPARSSRRLRGRGGQMNLPLE